MTRQDLSSLLVLGHVGSSETGKEFSSSSLPLMPSRASDLVLGAPEFPEPESRKDT